MYITNVEGKYLPEKLYDKLFEGKLNDLKKRYEDATTDITDKKTHLENLAQIETVNELNNKLKELEVKKYLSNKQHSEYLEGIERNKLIGQFVKYITDNFAKLVDYLTEQFKAFFGVIPYGAGGAILKFILVLLIILSIVLGIYGIIHGLDPNNTLLSNNNNLFIIKPDSISFLSKLSSMIGGMVPDEYRYKFSAMSNSFGYAITGKNRFDNELKDRELLETGRSDNIFHLNLTNNSRLQSTKTYCTIKPTDGIFKFNDKLYPNADYNKIDPDILNDLNYKKQYVVPITYDSNGKYIINLDNSYYNNQDNNNIYIPNLPPLFKYADNNNSITFHSFPNKSYTQDVINNSIIGKYGILELLNNDYVGPIIQLHHNNTKERTRFYISKDNPSIIYTLTDLNEKKSLNSYYSKNEIINRLISVDILFDQSGNQNHFIYSDKETPNRRPLLLFDSTNNKYYIEYITNNTLTLSSSIIYPKLKIQINIYINNINDIYTQQYTQEYTEGAFLLSGSILELPKKYTNILFSSNGNSSYIKINEINNNTNYKINSTLNDNTNNNNNAYSFNTIQTVNIYLDNFELAKIGSDNNEGFIGRIYKIIIFNNY